MNLSPEEEAELEEMKALMLEAAQALQSPWEPRCVARAFASETPRSFVLTMQPWIDLDVLRSPVLRGNAPATLEEFYAALNAFGVTEKDGAELTPEQAAVMAEEMLAAVSLGFGMSLPMRAERTTENDSEEDGFGGWLPVYACLVTQCGIDPDAAMRMRVDRTFALIAAHRRNQGWKVAGEPYATRDMEEKEAANG